MTHVVTLTPEELLTAALVGARRQVSAMVKRRMDSGGDQAPEPFDVHILGCMGELAAAKTFNLFWPDGVGLVSSKDVGGVLEVRCRRNGGQLWIKHNHKPHLPYLLIHPNFPPGSLPAFTLYGWIYGRDGWASGDPGRANTRIVALARMRPISELFEVVEALRIELLSVI